MGEMPNQSSSAEDGFLKGQLLLAMPHMSDPRFERSVVYLCTHSEDGAMGIAINRQITSISFQELLDHLGIDVSVAGDAIPVHAGGPVETGRGFVLHSADYFEESSLIIGETMALTATPAILRAIAEEKGPQNFIIALGYSGWAPGQLAAEIQANGWLHTEADTEIVFNTEISQKWPRALAKLGVDLTKLSLDSGHA